MKDDWVEATIGELVEQRLLEKPIDGNHGEIHPKKADFVEEGIPFVMASDLQEGGVNQLTCNKITREQAQTLRKGFSKQDDVLLSHKGTIGRVAILNTDHEYIVLTPQITYYRITEPNRLFNRFVYYYFQSPFFRRAMKRIASVGSTRAYIGITKQLDLPVVYPSFKSQKKIVSILDKAFEGIDKAIAQTEQNLASARELFESYLNNIFTQKGDDWVEKKLGDVCELQNGFAFKSKLFKETGLPVVRISSIQNGLVCDNRPVFTDPCDYKEDLSKYHVEAEDLLIAMSGATTGKVGFNRTGQIYLLNQRVGKFIPSNQLNLYFLYYFLSTRVEENLRISAGSAQPNLSTKQIKDFQIPLPPIAKQERIIEELDNLKEQAKQLEALYTQKLNDLKELKQSLLQQAFAGELTKEDAA
ncbi:MAG: restriction endonuclease subunit S [Akkermansiaceae bacterium]|nr:restriction endonuclease subunit S [Akkermansiaceae bacterium]